MAETERAVLAGGCFWGMQDLIRKRSGVISTRVGYSGGDVPNATYRNHGDHAEAIEMIFDPQRISYRDLLEVRFVQFFRSHEVGWKTIHLAAECAAELVQDPHPFSTKKFKTDGRSILADIVQATGEESLLNLAKRQYEFKSFVEPFLFEGIEFAEAGITPIRWWPLGRNRRVTIDPERSFGQPICTPESVPTTVLARAHRAEGSIEAVARWYMVNPKSVADAVEFEHKISAAA